MKMKTLSRGELLERLRARYAGRGRDGRSQLLDEICAEQGYTRKYAIRLLRGTAPKASGRKSPGPPVRYDGIRGVLADIWRVLEQPCGKRLVEALPLWLPHYDKHFNALSRRQRRDLKDISAATACTGMLAGFRDDALRGLNGTRPGSLLRKQIPIQGEVWDEKRPGFLEADSVAHCGGSLAGDFIWSLTYSDLASTWTEGRAVWNQRCARCTGANPRRRSGPALSAAGLRLRQRKRMAQLASDPSSPAARTTRARHPLAPLPQR